MQIKIKPEYIYYPATPGNSSEPPEMEDVEITGINLEINGKELPAIPTEMYKFLYDNCMEELINAALGQVAQNRYESQIDKWRYDNEPG